MYVQIDSKIKWIFPARSSSKMLENLINEAKI